MKIIETRVMYEGEIKLVYTLVQEGKAYGLKIESASDFYRYIYVDDVTRDFNKAMEILNLFADNTVFPENTLEVFDDLLGEGKLVV